MDKILDALSSLYRKAAAEVADLRSSGHFLFMVDDQPKDLFKVVHWQGNEGISTSYRYTLSLAVSGELVDVEKVLGKHTILSIDRDGEKRLIHGYVSEITHLGTFLNTIASSQVEEYEVVIESPLAKLMLHRQSRVFPNQNIKSVLHTILLDSGFTASSFHIELANTYPVHDYIVQHDETDFNFFTRLIEYAGLLYHFQQQDSQAFLVIQDDATAFPKMAGLAGINYQPRNQQVECSEAVLALQSPQPVRNRHETSNWQQHIYVAETHSRGMTAGTTFTMSGHPEAENNGDFLVVSVRHQGDQAPAFSFGGTCENAASVQTYRNELTLIKTERSYRTPVDVARRPIVFGVINSAIMIPANEYAYVTAHGYVTAQGKVSSVPTDITMLGQISGPTHIIFAGKTITLFAGCDLIIDNSLADIDNLRAHIQLQHNKPHKTQH